MLIRFFGCSDCPSQGLACRPEVNQGRITIDAIPGGWYRVSPVMVTTRKAVERIPLPRWRCVLSAVCEKAGPVVRLFVC
jgi:hypothetical protein